MMTPTIEVLPTGELCRTCGEEIVLERSDGGELEFGCACSCATTLC